MVRVFTAKARQVNQIFGGKGQKWTEMELHEQLCRSDRPHRVVLNITKCMYVCLYVGIARYTR